MGYRGKLVEREQARELRAESWTLAEIAAELQVSKSSVSLWVRDVDFVLKPRNRGHRDQRPHPLTVRKEAELEACRIEAETWLGDLTARELPALIRVLLHWLRAHFEIDESRLRCKLYLHEGLDLSTATAHRAAVTAIPVEQFRAPYRAVDDRTRRTSNTSSAVPP